MLLCCLAYLACLLTIGYLALYSRDLPYARTPPWRKAPTEPQREGEDESLLGELRRRQHAKEPVDIEDIMGERFNRRWDRLEAQRRSRTRT